MTKLHCEITISRITLSCSDDKIYIQNSGYDGLALAYQS